MTNNYILRYKARATSRTEECRLHNSVKLDLRSLELDFYGLHYDSRAALQTVTIRFLQFVTVLVRKLQEHVFLTVVFRKANCYGLEPSEIAAEAKFEKSC